MSLWKDTTPKPTAVPAVSGKAESREPAPGFAAATPGESAAYAGASRSEASGSRKESLIAADISIEGKIEGAGNVRIAGTFKGDVNVQGDLTIESGARLTGSVRASAVVIAGELEGNIEAAARVELQQGGAITGDIKAGSLTVAAGARMRGQAVFGWDEGASGKSGKPALSSKAEFDAKA